MAHHCARPRIHALFFCFSVSYRCIMVLSIPPLRGLNRHPDFDVLGAHLCVFCILCGPKALRFSRAPAPPTHRTQLRPPLHWPASHCRAESSDEHTSELQSLMRLSYAVCCSQNKTTTTPQ